MTDAEIRELILKLPQPIDLAFPGVDEAVAVQALMAMRGITESEAQFALALERGEIDGDIGAI